MALDPNYAASSHKVIGETLRHEVIDMCKDLAELAEKSTWENMLESAEATLPAAVVAHQARLNTVIATWQAVQTKATTPDEVHTIFAGLTAKKVPFKL